MKQYVFIGLLVLAAMMSCAKRPTAPPLQEDILYQLNYYGAAKPDSVMQILDTLDIDVLSEKERAHYCLLKVGVCDKLHLYGDETDSLLQVAEDYFIGGKDKYFEAETYEHRARIASKEGKGDQAKLECLLKALQSIEQCHYVDERFVRFSIKPVTEQDVIDLKKYRIHYKLGMCYLGNDYTKESLEHLQKAGWYFDKTDISNMRFQTANMLGNAYLGMKEYDSSLVWYKKGLETALRTGNVEEIAYSHFSNSEYFGYRYEQKDYEDEEEGRELLQQAIDECYQGLALYGESMFRYKDALYNSLSKYYFYFEQYDSCLYYSEKLLGFYEKRPFAVQNPSKWHSEIYWRLYQSHEALGNTEKALKYADLYVEIQKALEKQPKAVEQVKNEYDKRLEMMQMQNEQQTKRYRLYLLLALTLIALVVVLGLSNRYRKNKEIETLRQAEAYRDLQTEFETASQQAQQARQALQKRVMDIYKSGDGDRLGLILTEFAAAYPQGLEKLQANHPELTEAECHIVVLSFLQFRVKEEAELLGLSANTVAKYRTNIRKKVGSDPVSNLFK